MTGQDETGTAQACAQRGDMRVGERAAVALETIGLAEEPDHIDVTPVSDGGNDGKPVKGLTAVFDVRDPCFRALQEIG
ncbi:hypothetical protein [Streptomyces sp. SA15]|uniref:hypothetical protein n=1 Tax=Streptomyces sp. SA15 TaxID=934019 RepID=UPI0026B7C5A6|nr:hypothetical protein [Streptomyces sp. SA15]